MFEWYEDKWVEFVNICLEVIENFKISTRKLDQTGDGTKAHIIKWWRSLEHNFKLQAQFNSLYEGFCLL